MKLIATTMVDIEYGKWDWKLCSKDPNQSWKTEPVLVGIAQDEDDPEYKVIGLVYWGNMSHMAYRLKDMNLKEDINRDYFYFDAGGNGRPVRMKGSELEKAYRALGLLDG